MSLYFASQGAGRLLWPLLANLTRLAIAAGGGWLALRWSADISYVFLALGAALAVFGLMTAGAVAAGAWFGPIVWRRSHVLAQEGDRARTAAYGRDGRNHPKTHQDMDIVTAVPCGPKQ